MRIWGVLYNPLRHGVYTAHTSLRFSEDLWKYRFSKDTKHQTPSRHKCLETWNILKIYDVLYKIIRSLSLYIFFTENSIHRVVYCIQCTDIMRGKIVVKLSLAKNLYISQHTRQILSMFGRCLIRPTHMLETKCVEQNTVKGSTRVQPNTVKGSRSVWKVFNVININIKYHTTPLDKQHPMSLHTTSHTRDTPKIPTLSDNTPNTPNTTSDWFLFFRILGFF